MTGEDDGVPAGVLDDIAYLARSENRIRLLRAIAAEPRSRQEPSEATGVSRATLGRVVRLEEPPTRLFRPGGLWRVFRPKLPGRSARTVDASSQSSQ